MRRKSTSLTHNGQSPSNNTRTSHGGLSSHGFVCDGASSVVAVGRSVTVGAEAEAAAEAVKERRCGALMQEAAAAELDVDGDDDAWEARPRARSAGAAADAVTSDVAGCVRVREGEAESDDDDATRDALKIMGLRRDRRWVS